MRLVVPRPARLTAYLAAAALALTACTAQGPDVDATTASQTATGPESAAADSTSSATGAEPGGPSATPPAGGQADADDSPAPAGQPDDAVTTHDANPARCDPDAQPSDAFPTLGETPGEESWRTVDSNLPMCRLAPGQKPPQLVLFSFDGGGMHDRWQSFMGAAQENDARFTVFLTGTYLLLDSNRELYRPPGNPPGTASVAFGGGTNTLATLIEDTNTAVERGHEIGTHYIGHLCSGSAHGGDTWTREEWRQELDQFFTFLADPEGINKLPAGRSSHGADHARRTPALPGRHVGSTGAVVGRTRAGL
ncbi:MAG: hypothetical protein Q4G34_12085 [Micrococcus sp.]|nr:hypothetical protein [Micrococcus sp.]